MTRTYPGDWVLGQPPDLQMPAKVPEVFRVGVTTFARRSMTGKSSTLVTPAVTASIGAPTSGSCCEASCRQLAKPSL